MDTDPVDLRPPARVPPHPTLASGPRHGGTGSVTPPVPVPTLAVGVLVAERPAGPPAGPEDHSVRRASGLAVVRPWTVRVAAAVAVAAVAVAAGLGWSARGNLERTDRALAASRQQLVVTLGRLDEARATLTSVSGADHAAGVTLAGARQQLAAVQAQLATAQAHEVTEGVNISDLDRCLAAVEVALNQVSLDDAPGAQATLGTAAPVCQAARSSG